MSLPAYRLKRANYSGNFVSIYSYTYDPVGNRLTQDVNGTRTTYSYDNANRVTSVNGQTYTWDDNGNLLNDGAQTYSYDQANRLKQVVQGAITTTFAYNGAGDRLQQTVNGSPIRYVLDPAAGLTQVLSDGTNTYLYGNDRLAQYQTAMQYFGADGLGSVRQIFDASAIVVGSSRYDPFGNVMSQGGATSVFAFAGEQQDATGLQYLRARYYSSAQGRFTTRDVWEGDPNAPMSYNAWLYVYADPLNHVDPSGRQCPGCQGSGYWAEYTLFYGYGIRIGSPDKGLGGFLDVEKVLIADTVVDYANLLGGPERFKRNVALTSIREAWNPRSGDAFNPFYDPFSKSIGLHPSWYIGQVVRAPSGKFIIGAQPCMERFLGFPIGSLPSKEIGAKFTFAHEIGHAFHEGNRVALRDFLQKVNLPPSWLAWNDPNPLVSRNAFRVPFEEEVFGDVIAAYLYSPGLLNQQMLTWVQLDMPRTLR